MTEEQVTEEQRKDLQLLMFDALISLMDRARLEKDAKAFDGYARLVYETWTSMVDEQGEQDANENL